MSEGASPARMPAGLEAPIEWLRRRGHRVFLSESACWYDAAPRVFQSFPYHPVIDPSPEEIARVLRANRALAVRFSAPPSSSAGKISYHVVCRGPGYGLDSVTRQCRQNIRKGLDYATFGPVPFDRLAGPEGWRLRQETLTRQGRLKAENEAWWRSLCLSAEGLAGFEAWGAVRDGRLVAALIACLVNGSFQMLYQQSLSEHLRFGINNALGFSFARQALARPGVSELFYGFQSLDAGSDVDEFKFRMGFRAEPVRQRIALRRSLRPLVNPALLSVVDILGRAGIGGPKLLKVAGLIRYYVEGRKPASRQDCPECLLERKDTAFER